MKPGQRVITPDGPGTVISPFLSRGLTRHGDLIEDGWIVSTDNGKRRVYTAEVLKGECVYCGQAVDGGYDEHEQCVQDSLAAT